MSPADGDVLAGPRAGELLVGADSTTPVAKPKPPPLTIGATTDFGIEDGIIPPDRLAEYSASSPYASPNVSRPCSRGSIGPSLTNSPNFSGHARARFGSGAGSPYPGSPMALARRMSGDNRRPSTGSSIASSAAVPSGGHPPVTPSSLHSRAPSPPGSGRARESGVTRLREVVLPSGRGVTCSAVPPHLSAASLGGTPSCGGVLVSKLKLGCDAQKAGLVVGDIIVRVEGVLAQSHQQVSPPTPLDPLLPTSRRVHAPRHPELRRWSPSWTSATRPARPPPSL